MKILAPLLVVVIGLSAFGLAGQNRDERPVPVTRWEYKTISGGGTLPSSEVAMAMKPDQAKRWIADYAENQKKFLADLNTSGKQGWELVNVDSSTFQIGPLSAVETTAYLKRRR